MPQKKHFITYSRWLKSNSAIKRGENVLHKNVKCLLFVLMSFYLLLIQGVKWKERKGRVDWWVDLEQWGHSVGIMESFWGLFLLLVVLDLVYEFFFFFFFFYNEFKRFRVYMKNVFKLYNI